MSAALLYYSCFLADFLDASNLVFFRLREFIDSGDIGVGEFLHLVEAVALRVFRYLFVLEHFFETLVSIATDITRCGTVVFGYLMHLFSQLFATLLSQRRDRDADQLAIV